MNSLSMPRRRARGGFTLIELVVVIVILAILAAIVVPRFFGRAEEAKQKAWKTQFSSFESVISLYNADTGHFPPSLDALVNDPGEPAGKWKGPYLKQIPRDPWDGEYSYKLPGTPPNDYDIICTGPDGKQQWVNGFLPGDDGKK